MLIPVQHKKQSIAEVQDAEIERILMDLKAGERIRTVLISAIGRPDFGYKFVEKMKKANVPMTEDVSTTGLTLGCSLARLQTGGSCPCNTLLKGTEQWSFSG